MNIIKLNAIDSTNSYIKKLANKTVIESYTVVVANHQTKGRGQLGTTWTSKSGKNLTFSILVRFKSFKATRQFYLSMAVSLGVLTIVKKVVKISFKIKWPNDILAEKDKVAGILIENILSGNYIKKSVIGIGLNVNQENFPSEIGNVTSLKKSTGINWDKDILLKDIVNSIQYYIKFIEQKEFSKLKELYVASLYKYKNPTMFETKEGVVFLGKIVDVFEDGRLVVELENETTRKFNLKEIKFTSRKN